MVIIKTQRSSVLVLTLALLTLASTASAQLFRQGDTKGLLASGTMRGTDVAYDSKNGLYLVAEGNGALFGIFTNRTGDALGIITLSGGFAAFPRVEYSPDVDSGRGGFIVTYLLAGVGTPNAVHAVIVSSQSMAPVSADQVVSDGGDGGCWFEAGAAVAYSVTSRRFLVAYQTPLFSIRGRLLDLNGSPVSGGLLLANINGSRDPGLAWNPVTDEFGFSYSAFDAGAYVAFRKIRPDGSFATAKYSFGFAAGTFNTDLDVNPSTGSYVLVWDGPIGSVYGANAAEFDVNGNEVGHGIVSGSIGGSDNLSLAFNANSGTFLAVGQTSLAWDIGGVELNGRGFPISSATVLSCCASDPGSLYPRVAADASGSDWNVSFSRQFTTTADQIVSTTSSGGGGGPVWSNGGAAPPPPSTPPPPTAGACPGSDPFAAIGGGTCVNGGWQPPGSPSISGSAGGCPGSAPFSGAVCVGGGWIPGSGSSGSPSPAGGCPGTAPFANAVCVNGGWVPGSSAPSSPGASGGGCPGNAPFSGATCVNGGWVPGGSSGNSCSGGAPGSGWVCVSGGWVPPDSPLAGSGSSSGGSAGCATANPWTTIPGITGVCINGGWIPSNMPLVGSGSSSDGSAGCATPNPWTTIPGMTGVCISGAWIPSNMIGGRP